MKILLIDDDVFLRDMYTLKFQEAGDDITAVATATEAMQSLADNSYDIVITDMVIPGMSGLELLEHLQQDNTTEDVVKIVLSNQSEPKDKELATAAGANGYIVKADKMPSEVVEEVHTIASK